MEGSAIVGFNGGWACSNEANIIVEQKLIRNPGEPIYSKHTQVIRVMNIHFVVGNLTMGEEAEVVFKFEENDVKKSFETKVVGLTEEMAILAVTKETFNQKDIIKKIKGGYNYGK